ncbi:hypothetical protein SAMN05216388_101754 [Halorientalis persicus]|uniref:Uncharacterized protein n=1 Tax=Halorientalis persicus TaxID=1367881 RepID=A0A1H8RW00_9EURY|nr:hypothetical protein [Halorientalis persicus]SEO70525.1 hypothetical protein SAMN05216388_101754 [Halorientalis persicus]
MPRTVDITIEPNDKYDAVIRGKLPDEDAHQEALTEEEYREAHPAPDAADDYVAFVDEAAEVQPEDYGKDPEEIPTVSWDDISPSSDADLVAKMATYFTGMSPDEPTDLLRAKLRLLDVDTYIDAQLAATAELREVA